MEKDRNFLRKYLINYKKLTSMLDEEKIFSLLQMVKNLKKKNKILIYGNGAGAAIASHVASDFANHAKIRAISFDNSAQLTCLSNDYKFENWVTKTIEYYYDKGDLIILLSASGNSKNMVNAANYCNKKKINFFSITGFDKKNKLRNLSKKSYWINSKSYNFVELIQLLILLSIVDFIGQKNK